MKFVCLGFYDEAKFSQMPKEEAEKMMEVCFSYDDVLRRGGHFLGGEALDVARNALTLHRRNGEVAVVDGPFAETKEMLGGILLLEADDMQHAIALMSKHPALKMGNVFEIRPVNVAMNQLIAERGAAIASKA